VHLVYPILVVRSQFLGDVGLHDVNAMEKVIKATVTWVVAMYRGHHPVGVHVIAGDWWNSGLCKWRNFGPVDETGGRPVLIHN